MSTRSDAVQVALTANLLSAFGGKADFIVLLLLDVGLHVGPRYQALRMTKSLQFARPMMG